VVVVKQFTAQFQIKLALKLRYPLPDVLALDADIFIVVKSVFHRIVSIISFD
jgi:hypothetical protein